MRRPLVTLAIVLLLSAPSYGSATCPAESGLLGLARDPGNISGETNAQVRSYAVANGLRHVKLWANSASQFVSVVNSTNPAQVEAWYGVVSGIDSGSDFFDAAKVLLRDINVPATFYLQDWEMDNRCRSFRFGQGMNIQQTRDAMVTRIVQTRQAIDNARQMYPNSPVDLRYSAEANSFGIQYPNNFHPQPCDLLTQILPNVPPSALPDHIGFSLWGIMNFELIAPGLTAQQRHDLFVSKLQQAAQFVGADNIAVTEWGKNANAFPQQQRWDAYEQTAYTCSLWGCPLLHWGLGTAGSGHRLDSVVMDAYSHGVMRAQVGCGSPPSCPECGPFFPMP